MVSPVFDYSYGMDQIEPSVLTELSKLAKEKKRYHYVKGEDPYPSRNAFLRVSRLRRTLMGGLGPTSMMLSNASLRTISRQAEPSRYQRPTGVNINQLSFGDLADDFFIKPKPKPPDGMSYFR
jgi:hypothetical protein